MLSRKLLPHVPRTIKCSYATVASDAWPPRPTPYQVLKIETKDPYTKIRFNELVKVYHPDRKTHPECAHLSTTERLERYHLIVAAHALLSDPHKRKLYDRLGIGWIGSKVEAGIYNNVATATDPSVASAAHNATWEDWEKWRYEQAKQRGEEQPKQTPTYMANGSFVAALFVLTMGAATAQTMHAGHLTERRRLKREENHWRSVNSLEKTRKEMDGVTREERVERFIGKKDPAALGNPSLMKMMTEPDVCASGDETGRDPELDIFIKRESLIKGERRK